MRQHTPNGANWRQQAKMRQQKGLKDANTVSLRETSFRLTLDGNFTLTQMGAYFKWVPISNWYQGYLFRKGSNIQLDSFLKWVPISNW